MKDYNKTKNLVIKNCHKCAVKQILKGLDKKKKNELFGIKHFRIEGLKERDFGVCDEPYSKDFYPVTGRALKCKWDSTYKDKSALFIFEYEPGKSEGTIYHHTYDLIDTAIQNDISKGCKKIKAFFFCDDLVSIRTFANLFCNNYFFNRKFEEKWEDFDEKLAKKLVKKYFKKNFEFKFFLVLKNKGDNHTKPLKYIKDINYLVDIGGLDSDFYKIKIDTPSGKTDHKAKETLWRWVGKHEDKVIQLK